MSTVREEAVVREFPSGKLEQIVPSAPTTPTFLNRELSLLEFHARVLEEALDVRNPVLERLKFLAIFSSNLDEFFMIRVSGLKEEVENGVTELSYDGLTPAEQLSRIRQRLLPLIDIQSRALLDDILPGLKREGIEVADYESLSHHEKAYLKNY